MVIPEFPQFKDVDISCKGIVDNFISGSPLEASEYTFTNIFAYRSAYNFKISVHKNNLLVLKDTEPVSFFCPIGVSHVPDTLEEICDYLKNKNIKPCLERVPESFVNDYLSADKRFILEVDRDHFDYVYDVRELIELKGNKFHDKKNQINKFKNHYKYEYITLTRNLIGECLQFEDYWCEVKECEKVPGLKKERCAILEMLNNFETLDIKGGILRVENKIAALVLGEKILHDTFVIHVEKAHSALSGIYQVINQEFLMHEANDLRFVNREQDLGVGGLRQAKMSYNPVRFIKKYTVNERQT